MLGRYITVLQLSGNLLVLTLLQQVFQDMVDNRLDVMLLPLMAEVLDLQHFQTPLQFLAHLHLHQLHQHQPQLHQLLHL